ncbi:MAG: hypothetical protein AAB019_08000 [Planctomycetota bacterium]
MRKYFPFILILGSIWLVEMDPPLVTAEAETKKALDDQKEAERELKNLEAKMVRIAEKLKEIHPYYAAKLLQAREMMKKDLLLEDIREIVVFLENGLSGQALDKTNEINESLIQLLSFLEDKMDSRNVEEKIKKLEELMKTLKNIQDEEKQLLNDTEKFNLERYGEIDKLSRVLDELLREQQKLNDLLKGMESSPFRQQLEKALEKISQLRQAQAGLKEQADRLEQGDLKTVNDLLRRLNSLINQQSDILKETSKIPKSEQGLKKALEQIDRLIDEQKLLKDTNPLEAGFEKTSERQLKLTDEIAGLKESLKKLPVDLSDLTEGKGPLPQAEQKAREAGMNLEDEIPKTAAEAQSEAIDKLERARTALSKKLADLSGEQDKTLGKLAQQQNELAEESAQFSGDLKNSKMAGQPETTQNVQSAARQIDESAQTMTQASEQLSNRKPETALGVEQKALEKLKEAHSALAKLQSQLAGSKNDDFKKLAEQQSDLARQTQGLSEQLEKMAESVPEQPEAVNVPQRQKMQNAVNGAAQDTKEAIQSMNQAQAQLGQNNLPRPGGAENSQQEVADALKRAEEKLADLKGNLAEPDKSEILKQLAKRQEDLQKKTGELNKKINEQARQEPREHLKNGLNQAGTHTDQAGGEMKQSSGNMQQGAKANQQGDQASARQHQQSAQTSQEKAMDELAQAKQELEKVKNRDMTEEEKRRLEKLAQRQKEIEKKTQELAQESEKSGEKTPAQDMKNAGQKMNSASQSMGQGQSSQAQEEEDEALKELQRAYEQLAQKSEELSAQQALRFIEKLEKMLAEVMNKQQHINHETIRLESVKQKDEMLSREEQINLKKLAGEQKDLGRQIDEINRNLLKEHSVVFSWVLKTIFDDMNLSAELMEQHKRTDDYTQGFQRDIVVKLKELLDALKKEKKKKKAMANSGGGGGGGKMPLLSDVTELKMLKIMQVGLKRKTEEFQQKNLNEKLNEFDQFQKIILRRLSDEQGNLADLLDSFAQKLAKEQTRMPEK